MSNWEWDAFTDILYTNSLGIGDLTLDDIHDVKLVAPNHEHKSPYLLVTISYYENEQFKGIRVAKINLGYFSMTLENEKEFLRKISS